MPESNRTDFRTITLTPLMAELNANQLGASLVFSGNTPSSYFAHSLDRLNAFLTQQGPGIMRQQVPDVIEVMPPGYDPSRSMPYPRGQKPPTEQGGDVNVIGESSGLPAWDLTKGIAGALFGDKSGEGLLSKEAKLALFLGFVALVLIAAGVFSLR